MRHPETKQALSRILRLDAITCIAMGAALLVLGEFIARLTGLPSGLLFFAGVALIPIGLFMAATAAWWADRALPVWLIILGNAGWVVASLAVLAVVPSIGKLGVAFVLAQAAVVAFLAYLEWRNLYRPAVLA